VPSPGVVSRVATRGEEGAHKERSASCVAAGRRETACWLDTVGDGSSMQALMAEVSGNN
jgi:hypothetical protein